MAWKKHGVMCRVNPQLIADTALFDSMPEYEAHKYARANGLEVVEGSVKSRVVEVVEAAKVPGGDGDVRNWPALVVEFKATRATPPV